MKKITQYSKQTSITLSCFLGMILMITLMLPAYAVAQTSPSPVNLGTSDDFVVLAKTGISTTGTTSFFGDIGVSPESSTSITGFNLTLDASGEFSTSPLITGKVYAADHAAPTPTKMIAAVGDMETAYGDAAGRTPDFNELHAGDLTGQTLTTGVYKWGTGVQVSAGGFTISGSSTDVWIFQIAQNLTIANGAAINLTGGALASNIFWQVAGNVTLGTTSDFSGIILCQTLIDIQTGAGFDGKALSQTAVTIDGSAVGLDDLDLESGIVMYPNPGQNSVTISNSTTIKLDQVAIYDVFGKLINTIDLHDMLDERTIDLPNLSSGIYTLQIQGEGAITTKRWIKR